MFNGNIAVIGIGYVGLVTASCFAEMGIHVQCIDIDKEKIDGLKRGIIPIYEPGLKELVKRNTKEGRLCFHSEIRTGIKDVDVIFSAVGTPSSPDGSADLTAVYSVAKEIGRNMTNYVLVVDKSTVPVGTAEEVRNIILKEQKERSVSIPFDVASNPEFLKEGSAIKDFMSPDRVVVGVDSERAKNIMTQLYRPFLLNNFRVIFMDIASAELSKYACNAMLATRISFMNEVAKLCEKLGANVDAVRKGMGTDKRIGSSFLYAGCGYGGSCFPKDVKAIRHTAENNGIDLKILGAVDAVNNDQKHILFEKLQSHFKSNLSQKVIAVWGLSFKPGTDDIREATSLVTIQHLLEAGCQVKVYDPVAMKNIEKVFKNQIQYCTNLYDAAEGAHAIILHTEWKQFRLPAWSKLRDTMAEKVILDGRNIYNKEDLETLGFAYYGIGK